jgi:hypothetical protein
VEMGVRADSQDDEQVSSTVTRYMSRNSANRTGCNSGSSESRTSRNSEMCKILCL